MKKIIFPAILALMLLQGFYASANALEPISIAERDKRVKELTHVPFTGKASEKVKGYDRSCIRSTVTLTVTDAATNTAQPIEFQMFRPRVRARVPFVMVTPTFIGTAVLEPRLANQLCQSGWAAGIVDTLNLSAPSSASAWEHEDQKMKFAVESLRTVLDFAERDARIDKSRLGVIGLSMGGITASILAGLEPQRLKASVIVAAGGNLPYIYANSTSNKLKALRDFRMKALSIASTNDYEESMVKNLKYDPIHFAANVGRDRVLMVLADQDTKIPTQAQNELFSAMGKPDFLTVGSSHIGTLLGFTYLFFDSAVTFMKMRFDGQAGLVGNGRYIDLDM